LWRIVMPAVTIRHNFESPMLAGGNPSQRFADRV